ncbi:MAG: efflux RND transporter periplasmic adaptor subunit [Candidatus Aminicenantes bacterium]|nr:efflux RND transporter periplasmic adaptor subunit [Candidatus Aminicenantes bacterium]
MTNKIIAFALAAALALAGPACSRRGDRQGSGDEAATALATSPGGGRGPGRGAGLGPRDGRGRGRVRAWDPDESIQLAETELGAIDLRTALVSARPVSSHLEAMGKILASPFLKAIVSYPFPARIAEIHVRPGDWVRTGQEVVTLQSETVGEAKSDYFKALADAELAKSSYEREKRLFDRGAGAGKNLQAAEAELKVAQASLEAAEKKLHILGFTEEQVKTAAEIHEVNPLNTLYAPITGRIVDNTMSLGAMVDQSTEILTILDPRRVCVDANIYERDIAKIRKGQEVEVTVPAYPDLVFKGEIQYIGDILNEETRTITVRTQVENEGFNLKAGMFASLRILLGRRTKALTIPLEAVLDDGDLKLVFVKKDGQFFPREIKAGITMDGHIEVLSGLSEGDEVVTTGSFQLKSKLYEEILKGSHVH